MSPPHRCPVSKKIRHDSVGEAMAAFEEGCRTWRVPPIRWYRCPHCDGYHLSSQEEVKAPLDSAEREAAYIRAQRKKKDWNRQQSPFGVLDRLRPDPPAS